MAGWKKHFQTYNTGQSSPLSNNRKGGQTDASKFQSWLPEVYVGQPNRLERYLQYDQMDSDTEINTALDTISEFSTQLDEETETPFIIKWNDSPTETESDVLQTVLKQWCRVNDWNRRIFNTFRNTVKYGDQPFIRDPETWKLYYMAASDVMRVIVDEASGKEPAQYVIKNLDPNFQTMTATGPAGGPNNYASGSIMPTSMNQTTNNNSMSSTHASRGIGSEMEYLVDAKHVIHLALTDGMDTSWPFGNSILDPIFKTYKQKELLEDSIIIYRVQRAPERRIFYIDVGDMPSHMAMSHVERVKNEIHQRRIPTRGGGGNNMMDAQYNPISMLEDYFFAQCLSLDTDIPLLDGRILTLSEIVSEYEQGKENYAYGLSDKTFEMESAKIKWAGVTRRNAKVMKVTLDNGESVTATPDHKFILRDGSEVEAQYLSINDSLMPRELDKLSSDEQIVIEDIKVLEERMDTGDITIESDSDSHWFGLGAGIYIHNSAEGRGSKVETLPGGQNLGDIDDLKFFNNKLARGLRVPSSYLPTGPDDGTASYNDGRVGTSFIQEYRFTQYCRRLQNTIQPTFDKEFKMFLKHRGYEIDSSQFNLRFVEPQSFSDYREIEINGARASVFGQIEGVDYISKRFALKKYLQLSDSEILENEKLWMQENPDDEAGDGSDDDSFSDLGNVGVQGGLDGSLDDFEVDDEAFGDADFDAEMGGDEESPIGGEPDEDEQ